MKYEINENRVKINDKHDIEFKYNVKAVIEVTNTLIVLLDVPPKESMSENIFGVTSKGQILWQVESRPDLFGDDDGDMYVGLLSKNEDEITAFRWQCLRVSIDIHTGKIKSAFVTK